MSTSSASPNLSESDSAPWRLPEYRQDVGILVHAPDPVVGMSSDGVITLWNAEAEKTFGWTAGEVLGKPFAEVIIPKRLRGSHEQRRRRFLDDGDETILAKKVEIQALHKSGEELLVELTLTVLPADPPSFMAFIRDITDVRALEAERARLAALVDSSPQSMMVVDAAAIVIGWTRGAEAMTGYSETEAIGRNISFLTPPGLQDENREIARALIRGDSIIGFETKSRRKDGTIIDISLSAFAARDESGLITAIASTGVDITERKRAEGELRASHERFRTMFDLFPLAAALASLDEGILFEANQAFFDATGLTPETAFGRTDANWLFPDGEGNAITKELAETGRIRDREITITARGGVQRTVLLSAVATEIDDQPVGLWVAVDVTRQRMLEERVRQSENIAVAGRVAAGLAHDFTNLVSVMQGQTELMLAQASEGSAIHAGLSEVHSAALTAASLTSQLLAVGGRQQLSPETVYLGQLLDDMHGLVVATLGTPIRYSAHTAVDLWAIEADPVQLERVLMNLVINGKDAMPFGGTLEIACANVDVVEELPGDALSGPCVEMRIKDDGVGMDLDTQARLFEPFYTTKPNGNGLGLATVHSIVTQSGGRISVSSVPDQGTEFRLLFPREVAATD